MCPHPWRARDFPEGVVHIVVVLLYADPPHVDAPLIHYHYLHSFAPLVVGWSEPSVVWVALHAMHRVPFLYL